MFGLVFDLELKESVREKRFAVTQKQRLALVLAHADEDHLLTMIIASGFPLLVQLVCSIPYDGELRASWG